LNSLDLKNTIENLIETFLEAGKIAKKISEKGVKITIKPDKSPVTDGDIEVDKILRKKIAVLTPSIPIVSEETINFDVKNKYESFWLVDPIDGTKDYIKKRDEYTLNAGLIINLKPTAGIIYAPAKNRLFFSYGKNSAFEIFNGKNKKLTCAKKNIDKIIGLENSAYTPDVISNIYKQHNVTERIKMSSSLKFCVLAAGEVDIYAAKARAYEWDIAAGHAILINAGGFLTDHDGKEFLYGKENYKNLPIIAKRALDLKK